MRETTIQDLEKKTTLECYMTGFNDGQKEAREEEQKKQVKICKKCIHSGKNKNTEQEKELLDLFNNVSDLMKENIIEILKETQIRG